MKLAKQTKKRKENTEDKTHDVHLVSHCASLGVNDDFIDLFDPNLIFPSSPRPHEKMPPPLAAPPASCDCVLPDLDRKDQAGEAGLACSIGSRWSLCRSESFLLRVPVLMLSVWLLTVPPFWLMFRLSGYPWLWS